MSKVKRAACEPSTWAGLAAIFQALKFLAPQHAVIIDGVTAAVGAVAVVMREQGARSGGAGDGDRN